MRECDINGCYRKHAAKGLCDTHYRAMRKATSTAPRRPAHRPPQAEYDWERARDMLEDGASYREVSYSLGIPRTTLRENLPGMGWTQQEGGQFVRELTSTPERRTLFDSMWDPKRRQA